MRSRGPKLTGSHAGGILSGPRSRGRSGEGERKLSETPHILKMPSGFIHMSPWLTISNKQAELMAKSMAELRLTQSSPSGCGAV